MAKTIVKVPWILNLLLTIFFDPIWNGINRIIRGKVIIGILWIITGGFFCIGWIIDIITVLLNKDIIVLA
ncbi:MAG: TM2 domain-containing protein [Dehalococcoidia bacterium]|nr:TM2 domain-containing protein [Dehalococcoidia bacterium]